VEKAGEKVPGNLANAARMGIVAMYIPALFKQAIEVAEPMP
jgi:hypothetical protein